jgi:exosortase/archaeosortase family protein
MARPRCLILLLVQAAAFWPVWRWAWLRADDGLAATAIVAILALAIAPPARRAESARWSSLALPTALTLTYVAAALLGPPLLAAMTAACALLATCSAARWDRPPHPAAMGLVVLGLPALPTAQFVLGYPLRVAAGDLAAGLLSLAGFAASRDGVSLRVGERLVAIDAPCSGVNMLWTALLLALVVAGLARWSWRRTAALAAVASLLAIAGNGLRAASLALAEGELMRAPVSRCFVVPHGVAHEGLGLVVFALFVALPTLGLAARWRRSEEAAS